MDEAIHDSVDHVPASSSNSSGLMSRISAWFKRGGNGHAMSHDDGGELMTMSNHPDAPKSTFLRPWARQEQAINNLQNGFTTLTDLMAGIRSNLERTAERQDELLKYLAHLPDALQSIPESNRVTGETLKAIHQQLTGQGIQQGKLVEILDRLSTAGGQQKEVMDDLRERVEVMRETDQKISGNLSAVGSAMESVSRSAGTSALVLEQMRDRIDSRDGQIERVLMRQGSRFTMMLSVAIFLSIAAILAVCGIGYLVLMHKV